jgi:hypothetical protein
MIDTLARTWEEIASSPFRFRVEVWDAKTKEWYPTERGYSILNLSPSQALRMIEEVEKFILEFKKGKKDDKDRPLTDHTISEMP